MPSTAKRSGRTEHHEKLFLMLVDQGYRCLWSELMPQGWTLEAWSGERGLLIVQAWKDGGVEIYHNIGVPYDWQELNTWLEGRKQ